MRRRVCAEVQIYRGAGTESAVMEALRCRGAQVQITGGTDVLSRF